MLRVIEHEEVIRSVLRWVPPAPLCPGWRPRSTGDPLRSTLPGSIPGKMYADPLLGDPVRQSFISNFVGNFVSNFRMIFRTIVGTILGVL